MMSKSCLRKVNFVFAIELFVTDFVTGELDISLKRQKQMHGYFAGRSQRRQCVAIFAGHKGHRKVSCLEGCLGGASWPLCLGLVRFMSWMGLRALCVLDGASCPRVLDGALVPLFGPLLPLSLGWGFVPFTRPLRPLCLGWVWIFFFWAAVPLCLVSKLTFSCFGSRRLFVA